MDPAMPFSLVMLFELLLGELGPEPGALLHADSEGKWVWKNALNLVSVKSARMLESWPSSQVIDLW